MKKVKYTADAARDLKRHKNMAQRLQEAVRDFAANPLAHANNVRALKGSTAKRMVVGDYRIIFEETKDEIKVTKIGPRGSVYK